MECAVSPRAGAPPRISPSEQQGALLRCVERRWYVSATFQCATAMVGRRMIARLVAKRAEASPLVRTRHCSSTALGSCVTASFHRSHHLVVCVRSFLPHRPVFKPLLVGRSVAPTQQMGSYARVVDAKALTVGGMCGIVGWREAKAVMRLYQRFPFRQQSGPFGSGRCVVAAALLLRGHTTPAFLCVRQDRFIRGARG
jgi:hypothetical protein